MSTTCHIGSSGSYVHYLCYPNTKSIRYAAWANCDAHSLACLMLNPNRHSRLSLSESMVRQLYQSMDYVLSINSGRSRLWTIDSFTLRCTLAVSSLFGELIHIPSNGNNTSLTRCELDETKWVHYPQRCFQLNAFECLLQISWLQIFKARIWTSRWLSLSLIYWLLVNTLIGITPE